MALQSGFEPEAEDNRYNPQGIQFRNVRGYMHYFDRLQRYASCIKAEVKFFMILHDAVSFCKVLFLLA